MGGLFPHFFFVWTNFVIECVDKMGNECDDKMGEKNRGVNPLFFLELVFVYIPKRLYFVLVHISLVSGTFLR